MRFDSETSSLLAFLEIKSYKNKVQSLTEKCANFAVKKSSKPFLSLEFRHVTHLRLS